MNIPTMNRLVSIARDGGIALRINGHWYTGTEAERRATKADSARAEWLRQQQAMQLPLYDGEFYTYPCDSERMLESDAILDLVHVLGFSEAEAAMILETSRLMARIKASIDAA